MVATGGCGGGDGDGSSDAGSADAPAPLCSPLSPSAGAGGGSNPGFVEPTAVTEAYRGGNGAWTLVGPADWSCLGDGVVSAPTGPASAAGTVVDFQTGNALGDAAVTAFECADLANEAGSATSGATGDYSLDVAARIPRWNVRIEAAGQLDTYHANLPLTGTMTSPQDITLESVSELTANALPAFIGVTRIDGRGLVIGTVVDCNGDRVANAAATMSAQSATVDHLLNSETYYFSAGTTSLPVRRSQQDDTNSDGTFLVLDLTPSPAAFVQVWGFVAGQDPILDPLTLLSEVALPIVGDTFIHATSDPLR